MNTENAGNHFEWTTPSIRIVMDANVEPGRMALCKFSFGSPQKCVLRYTYGVEHPMFAVHTFFAAFLIIGKKYARVANLPQSPEELWKTAAEREISTDCTDGISLRMLYSEDTVAICWKNALDWDPDLVRPEFESFTLNRFEFVEAVQHAIEFLNGFSESPFNCVTLKYEKNV
jgi:hypothetical protein